MDLFTDRTEMLRIVADRVPVFVSYMGTDHRYKYVNQCYANWFQMPAEEIVGKTRAELFGDGEGTTIAIAHENEAFSGRTSSFEFSLEHNGKTIYLDVDYIPDFDPDTGEVRGVIGVGQDVTLRRHAFHEALDAQARYKALADAFPNMMWTYVSENEMGYVNQKALSYFGISDKSEFRAAIVDAVHPDEVETARQNWAQGMETGNAFKTEMRLKGADGTYRWFLAQAQPMSAGSAIGYWIVTATDIDEQRRLSHELFEAKNAAENANRAKTEFLANMSHEIRTPLGAILGFSDLMRDPLITPVERDQYAATIARNGRMLTRIIDDILDLAKVESGRMEAEEMPFSLPDLINEVMSLFNDTAKQKGIALRFHEMGKITPWLSSDPTRLRQILINVIGNAMKFTDEGSVDVTVATTPTRANRVAVTISVRDTGRGIPAPQRARLFKPFTQADTSTTRRYGGTGLGLALSRRLSEALGGTLELTPEQPSKGAEFVIRINAKMASQVEKPIEVAQAPNEADTGLPLAGVRVLLVDDSLDNQSLVRHVLKKMGANVDVANNGREGVAAAWAAQHDVVLMDIQMPEMDGYQALAALKDGGFETPVIALTAHALNEERVRTRNAGFSSHLTKPIDKSALLETLSPYRH